MPQILEDAVIPALSRRKITYFRAGDNEAIVVPLPSPSPESGTLLIIISADDRREEALLTVKVCDTPPARRADVALLLADINAKISFVTFSMLPDGSVLADVPVELSFAADREALIAIAFGRLVTAAKEWFDTVARTAHRKRKLRRSLVECQITELLQQTPEL
jgi:hypothetical protein